MSCSWKYSTNKRSPWAAYQKSITTKQVFIIKIKDEKLNWVQTWALISEDLSWPSKKSTWFILVWYTLIPLNEMYYINYAYQIIVWSKMSSEHICIKFLESLQIFFQHLVMCTSKELTCIWCIEVWVGKEWRCSRTSLDNSGWSLESLHYTD